MSPGSGLGWYWGVAEDAARSLGSLVFDAFYAGLAAFIASREELGGEEHFSAMRSRVSSLLDKLGEAMGVD